MKNKIIIFLISLVGATALKAELIQFQNIRTGGTGCPSSTTQIAYAPDNSTASLIFQNFNSHVPVDGSGPKVIRTISQQPCNVFVEVKLPIGHKLDSLEIRYDMRGNTILDRGVVGYFRSFLVNASGLGVERSRGRNPELIQEKTWMNSTLDQFEDFLIQSSKKIQFQSECRTQIGQDRIYLQLQHHVYTQITNGYENTNAQGTITMDTSDMAGGLKLLASTSSCNAGSGSGSGIPTPGRNCRLERINGRTQQVCQ